MRFKKNREVLHENINHTELSHFIKTILNLKYGDWNTDVFSNPTSNRKKYRKYYNLLGNHLKSRGSSLKSTDFDLHHMDGIHINNSIYNLAFLTHSQHSRLTNYVTDCVARTLQIGNSTRPFMKSVSYICRGLFYLLNALNTVASLTSSKCSVTLYIGNKSISLTQDNTINIDDLLRQILISLTGICTDITRKNVDDLIEVITSVETELSSKFIDDLIDSGEEVILLSDDGVIFVCYDHEEDKDTSIEDSNSEVT